ncbi:MAG: bifunctional adenosylcobinamide kinase/adenosylcobinamide-phosphate guanylyltransferase [Deltaproteobacteria bacterium]|nr:MAG: bifunctional adenosylcobinamide kinase/adenosylcobinamide-phosphate guanylyltransferase [Deltaproteobacteria bacterium]
MKSLIEELKKEKIVLITGGARSGKSDYALKLAGAIRGQKAYLATAQPLDKEMEERIRSHKEKRGNEYVSIEEPLEITQKLKEIDGTFKAVIIDCLTLWVSNLMHQGGSSISRTEEEIREFVDCTKKLSSRLIMVTNEVGMGIVPDNEMARSFRDLIGFANQLIAGIADGVVVMFSGSPLRLK